MGSGREQLNHLQEIRSLMERSSTFVSLSGLSGVIAGIMGLTMAVLLHLRLERFLNYTNYTRATPQEREEQIIFTFIVSVIVLAVTFSSTIYFTARKAKKNGLAVWGMPAKNVLINLFIPLVTGGLFCAFLLLHYFDFIVLPSMLVFYGLALLNAGKFTMSEIKWLGISEILLGLAALFALDYALIFWGLGFGVMNIIYGTVMYFRHER